MTHEKDETPSPHSIPMEDRRAIAKGIIFMSIGYIFLLIIAISAMLHFMGVNNYAAIIVLVLTLGMNLKFMHVKNHADELLNKHNINHNYNVFAIARAIA